MCRENNNISCKNMAVTYDNIQGLLCVGTLMIDFRIKHDDNNAEGDNDEVIVKEP